MKKLHTLLLALLLAAVAAQAQERTITGTILDGEFQGEPLIGATIAVGEGQTRVGTVTDLNGHFSLTLLASIKKVTVSYMGYEPRIITLKPNQTKYDITLFPSSKGLGEVIVTGYQQIDRRKLTAAVAEVKISDETVGAIKNIDQALAGQVAGLSSVTASGAPGAPVPGGRPVLVPGVPLFPGGPLPIFTVLPGGAVPIVPVPGFSIAFHRSLRVVLFDRPVRGRALSSLGKERTLIRIL